ncbi:hypothetical protein [Lysobacter panacisoli]|uniref:Secreted protein n=1 Tax=Lysobacter panacisoli TaxID=1255263 RepID=A0ABP9L8Q7_9GAMM|nr:hypothetical protein [Lysobacter panacisoli]
MRSFAALLALALLLVASVAGAKPPYVPLEQRLTAEQLQATGLDTLSAEQLRLLNQLLSEDRENVAKAAVAEQAANDVGLREKRTPTQSVTANVQGEVKTLARGSTITLDNGQRWRVNEGSLYLRKGLTNPPVVIEPGFMGVWYLKLDGQSLKVQRVD